MKKAKPRGRKTDGVLLRLMPWLFLAAFALYFALNIYRSLENPFLTARAVAVTLLDTETGRGYIVREESVLPGGRGLVMPELRDGEKAAKGQTVATAYSVGADSGEVTEMRELKARIERLRAAASVTPEQRAGESQTAVFAIAGALARRELDVAEQRAVEAESLIMSASDPESARAEIASLEGELAARMARIPSGTAVTAGESGVFAFSEDGFEGVSPAALTELTPADLDALFAFPGNPVGAGKLVTGIKWYLALVTDGATAARLMGKSGVTVRLTSLANAEFRMKLEDVGRDDGSGERVVLLSCSSGMDVIIAARAVTAEIVFDGASGIRVPKEAIRLELALPLTSPTPEPGEDTPPPTPTPQPVQTPFVYLAEGRLARRVRITIITEFGDAYIAEGVLLGDPQPGESSRLRDGSEIIVKANNLFDGKVVR
ncbi:MAG: hypothetical protein LBN99_08940 [Oscillospiraceae bacterium]|jgi:hypothetical protein|nr:hypothetical protein [Oscillospiraceae bacterium]